MVKLMRRCQTHRRQHSAPSVWQADRGGEGSGPAEAAAVAMARAPGQARLDQTQRRSQRGPTALRTRLTMRQMRTAAPSAQSALRYGALAVALCEPVLSAGKQRRPSTCVSVPASR